MDIEISGLVKVFRGGRRALGGVDLSIGGGLVGLLGPNGAGKTTLMRILTGAMRPTEGRVMVGGHDMAAAGARRAAQRRIGYLPQELVPYPDLTGREFLDYVALLKGVTGRRERRAQIDELLERVGLGPHADRRTGAYSGGMRRRAGIAQCLLGNPGLVVVDEPTAGLDPEERMRFRALLADLGRDRTVLLSTHILDDVAQSCPRVAVLDRGALLFDGTTSDLARAAEGRTFEVPDGTPLTPDTPVVATTPTTRRIVAADPPPQAHPVPPSLEDGYLALTSHFPPR